MSDAGEIVGMVDVLKLTYATLDQASTLLSQPKLHANLLRSTTSVQLTAKDRLGTSFGSP
jgi:hypothetical protein